MSESIDMPNGPASAADLLLTLQKMAELAENVQRVVEHATEIVRTLTITVQRVESLEERFREHGHIGDGLGSCWDGT